MLFLEIAKGVAMESLTITPSTNLAASTTFTPKIETKDIQPTKVQAEQQQKNTNSYNKESEIDPKIVSSEFNKMSDALNLDVKFAYNEKIDTVYINVTDKDTGKVIRKLPTEDAMKIKESMKDLIGVLFDEKG